jgi:hypothetical protein
MQTTRGAFLTKFLRFVTENDDAEARNIAEDLLNDAIQTLWLSHDWLAFQSPEAYQIATVVDVGRYALPAHFARLGPGHTRNLTTGARLFPITQERLDEDVPTFGTDLDTVRQAPTHFQVAGLSGVFRQPVGAGWALEVVSDDGDDTDVVVSIDGEDSTGIAQRKTFTLTGTTEVAVGTWRFIDGFGKSYTAAVTPGTTSGTLEHTTSRGTVTLRRVSPDTASTLQALAHDEASRGHQTLRLYPTPDAAYTIAVPIHRHPMMMLYDGDPIPPYWEQAVREEMLIQWRVNTGELTLDQATTMIRPAYLALMTHDNRHRPRPRKVPFGGR